MSIYIQIPNRITQIKGRQKFNLIYCYALIRSKIKDNTYKASYLECQLADQMNVTERSIRNYIKKLHEDTDLFLYIEKKQGSREYKYNIYHLDSLNKDYFVIKPNFFAIPDLSASLKGMLLLLKAHCIKGTDYLIYKDQKQLAETLCVGKNNIKKPLEELQARGYIKIIDKTIHLNMEYFPLSIRNTVQNRLYEIIYKYCLMQNVTPPYKDTDTNDLGMIGATFTTPEILFKALKERCPKLPKNVSMSYFTELLIHKKADTRMKTENIIID